MWPTPFAPITTGSWTPGTQELVAPVTIAASTSASAVTALPGNSSGDPAYPDIRIENQTNGWAMCNFGDASVAAATLTNGVGVPPGAALVIRVGGAVNSVSVILAAGATSGNVRFLRGSGLD
jgi:hypothetical protein